MAKSSKSAWYGVAAAALGTGVFFLAANKGRLFKKGQARIKALLSEPQGVPAAPPAPSSQGFEGRTPTPENGHVRDVVATNPPPPETGSNLTPQGDVHAPKK